MTRVLASSLPAIVPCLEYWDRLWPGSWLVTGDGLHWSDPRAWVFFVRVVYGWSHVCEYLEHGVRGRNGEEASIRMQKTLVAAAPDGDWVRQIDLYHVHEPMTKDQLRRIEQANYDLRRWKENHGECRKSEIANRKS